MGHRIIKDFERSARPLIERLRGKVTALGLGAPTAFKSEFLVDPAIKPVRDDMKVFGTAFTVLVSEPDILLPSYATKLAKPGDVLVIDAGGRIDISVWGNSMALSAMNREIAGVVIDGAVNDKSLLRGETEYTASEEKRRGALLPVFARGTTASFGGWDKPGSINVPVRLGGRTVEPGDLVVGDVDGVMVVPQARLAEVEDRIAVLAGMAKDLTWHPRIRAGELWFDILSLDRAISRLGIPEQDR